MADLSFYCSVDFCSCEVTMTIYNQLQLGNNDLSYYRDAYAQNV